MHDRGLSRSDRERCRSFFAELVALENRTVMTPIPLVGPNIDISRYKFNQSETQIAINPTNPLNLFAVSNQDTEHADPQHQNVIFGKYSTNGGLSWNFPAVLPGEFGPAAALDPGVVFDKFGNLFVSYLASPQSDTIAVLISTDGGQSFTNFVTATDKNGVDFDNLAVGPANAQGGESLWVSYGSGPNVDVAHAAVTGLGSVGRFSAPISVPRPGNVTSANLGNIAVGPDGQVAVAYMDTDKPARGPGDIYVSVDPNGVDGAFGPARLVTTTRWGTNVHVPNAFNFRGVMAEPYLAYDDSPGRFRGRLYLSYLDSPAVGDTHSSVYVRYSTADGTGWSDRIKVNNGTGDEGTAFYPSLSVDPVSGMLGETWYDSVPNTVCCAQFYAGFSDNGGRSFSHSVRLSEKYSWADRSDPAHKRDAQGFGDYVRNAFYDSVFHASWSDNSNSTHKNPDGEFSYLDLYTDTVNVLQSSATKPRASSRLLRR